MQPLVSIITPAYNCQNFIESCINSVIIEQGYDNVELIIVDDRSTDATVDIIRKYISKYPQIVLCENIRGKGPSGARNTGLLKARGEYITFLDADDIWLPRYLITGIEFLRANSNVDVVFYNFNVVDYETKDFLFDWFSKREFRNILKCKEIGDGYYLILDNMLDALLRETFLSCCHSTIIRNSICSNILFNENVKHSEDREYVIRLYNIAKANFAFKDIITSVYYRHKSSLTWDNIENNLNTISDHIFLLNEYLRINNINALQRDYIINQLCISYLSKAYIHRKKMEFKEAVYSLVCSTRYKINSKQLKELIKILVAYPFALIQRKK